jgi:hypothetical protein
MFPEIFPMNDTPLNLSKKRCICLVQSLNTLCKTTRYELYLDEVTHKYHIYDIEKDIILIRGDNIVGAFQFHILNYKE